MDLSAHPPGLLAQLPPPASDRTGWPWTEETPPAACAARPADGRWPRISVVCPSFRQGRFIEETIRSVLLQNYPELEFIIMDGGSDDETVAILEKYAPWIAHWESQPDRGQSHALNKGFERATGGLFGWINSDDYYQPGAFAAVARRFRSGRRELFFGDYDVRRGDDPALRRAPMMPTCAFQLMVGGRILPTHATFWPRCVHQPFNESLQFTMDADLFKRFGRDGVRPRYIPQSLGVFREHPAAKTSTLERVAYEETQRWFRAAPWYYTWLHRLSRWLDRARNVRKKLLASRRPAPHRNRQSP